MVILKYMLACNRLLAAFVAITLIAGCTAIPAIPTQPPATATTVLLSASTPTPQSTPTPKGPTVLRLWLPPNLDPQADSPSGKLLKARLAEFGVRRPGVEIDVRIKAQEGPGGLYDSLLTASGAAPLVMPDLVALPRSTLEAAVQKGLLHSYDGLTSIMDDTDWFDYARQLSRVQNTTYGIPIAANFLVLAYRSESTPSPPTTIEEVSSGTQALLFPAADPQALFTLLLYETAGGKITDDQGKPNLDLDILKQVLSTYQHAQYNTTMPAYLTQYQTYSQIWQAFTEERSDLAIIWFSDYLNNQIDNTQIAPVPTAGETATTLTTGWVWAFANPDGQNSNLAIELADYLSSDNFVANWATSINLVPARQSSINFWGSSNLRAVANQIASSATILSSYDVLAVIEPALGNATTQVLKDQVDPANAAQEAIDSLKSP